MAVVTAITSHHRHRRRITACGRPGTCRNGSAKPIAGRLVLGFRLFPLGWVTGRCESPIPQDTDDRGQFEFHQIAAGEYYLVALPAPFGRSAQVAPQDGIAGVAPTFFPDSEDVSGAQPIHVGAGQTVSDITLTMRPASRRARSHQRL